MGYINITLALFNMLLGFPMDGGRVLRAIVWWVTGNAVRATRIAARTGQVVACGFIVLGLLRFPLSAARASCAEMELRESFRGVCVDEVITRDCPLVDGHMTVQTFVEDMLLRTGQRCFVVTENDAIAGLITLHEVKAVDRARWPSTLVSDVMRPLAQLRTVTPETPVTEALEMLGHNDINQMPVVTNRRLVGMLSREHILRYLLTRAELHM
jgi:CBS domain-containing protein